MPPFKVMWLLRKDTFSRVKNVGATKGELVVSFVMQTYFFFNIVILSGFLVIPFFWWSPVLCMVLISTVSLFVGLTYYAVFAKTMTEESYKVAQLYKYKLKVWAGLIRLKRPLNRLGLSLTMDKAENDQTSLGKIDVVSTENSTLFQPINITNPTRNSWSLSDPVITIKQVSVLDNKTVRIIKSKEFEFNAENPFSKVIVFFRYKAFMLALMEVILRRNLKEYGPLWLQTNRLLAVFTAARLKVTPEKLELFLGLNVADKEFSALKDLPVNWIYKACQVENPNSNESSINRFSMV